VIDRLIELCAKNRLLTITALSAIAAGALWCVREIPLDAIPDLSDTQVIVFSRWDRSPDIIEDQVTYPIVTSLLGAPRVKAIRGYSDFGFSYVYVIFEDGTDIYWARSRVLEYLSKITAQLPEGVRTEIGPDASGVGWVYQYALVDRTGQRDLQELRSFQDWSLRYHLQSVPGVAEVASIGGFVKQYQVVVDPNDLAAYGISITDVTRAVEAGNLEVGGRLIEWSGREYMVRGRGYARSVEDIGAIVVKTGAGGVPVLVRDVGHVVLGPEIRRGVGELDGLGEAVGGIVVMRHGENALNVIKGVKRRIDEVRPGLPEGVELVPVYDRSVLIGRSIDTLKETLIEEVVVVSLIILVFLWHVPSATIPIVTIPFAILLSFIPMYGLQISSNIMSLGGIAVAIGALVDSAIVVVENSHKRLEEWQEGGRVGDCQPVLIKAIQEVGRPSFYALLVIAVSFMPVFTLEAQEGRLFRPLALTKNFAMAIAAVLAITLDPALRLLLIRLTEFRFRPRALCRVANAVLVGRIRPEDQHPISRALFRLYEPCNRLVLRWPKATVLVAVAIVVTTIPVYLRLGKEFMPPLNEGTILYMPTTLPGLSVTEAARILQEQDRILKSFPEVERVFGKAGRAETATDPAPYSMIETVVALTPPSEWRHRQRWYSSWAPDWLARLLAHGWPDRISYDDLVAEMDAAMRMPGWTNAWTMPIKARIDMLTTGVRTPIGIKIFGADLVHVQDVGAEIERVLAEVPGTRSIYAERTAGGYFVDVVPRREEIARYGLSLEDVQGVVMSAIGGENVTTTVEGRERYPVNVRYARDFRSSLPDLERVLVPTPSGAQVPLAAVAEVRLEDGPAMIRNENGLLAGYVYVDMAGRDIGSYVEEAKALVAERVKLPAGYSIQWSGQYEYMARVKERLGLVVPITIALVFFLIYLNTRSTGKTLIVMLAVPFSAVGAVWFLYLLDYNVSIAVWVGLIALLGLDAETGIFMLLYLDLAYEEWRSKGRMRGLADLKEAIHHGAVRRVRPKVMTVATTALGLVPILWSTGTGADVMKRIAAPMVGGLATSFAMELLVYPPIFLLWKWWTEVRHAEAAGASVPAGSSP
jgi:Cu(I)/Ag(I) efflux system membrane protein CusA/SilA